MSDSFAMPWTVAHQTLWPMVLPSLEYCSGLLFPSPGSLPNPGIEPAVEPTSPTLAGGFFIAEPTGKNDGCVRAKLLQFYLILCDPMDGILPGAAVHGIFQARILKWIAVPSARGSSQPRDQTHIFMSPALADSFFITSTTWEAIIVIHESERGE